MRKIAVFFPGTGYHCDKPLLYYARKLAKEIGFEEQICIKYDYDFDAVKDFEELEGAYPFIFAQIEEQLNYVNWNAYDEILFVCKSMGTVLSSMYIEKHHADHVKQVWFTPVANAFARELHKCDTIAFLGTLDPISDVNEISKLCKEKAIPLSLYESCNHSLECESVRKNIKVLDDIMEKTLNFLSL